MCPRDDFLISIIDGPGRKPSEFANPFRLAQKAMAKFLSSRRSSKPEARRKISGKKTSLQTLAFAKISSRALAGDFGVGVVCASEHHFFLDITFY
jgi:hypothetical protein